MNQTCKNCGGVTNIAIRDLCPMCCAARLSQLESVVEDISSLKPYAGGGDAEMLWKRVKRVLVSSGLEEKSRWRQALEDIVADPGEDLAEFRERVKETASALLEGRSEVEA